MEAKAICPFFRTGDGLSPLLTMQEVADLLRVSPSYCYKLVDGGRLRALSLPIESRNGGQVSRRVLRVSMDDLAAFISSIEVINDNLTDFQSGELPQETRADTESDKTAVAGVANMRRDQG